MKETVLVIGGCRSGKSRHALEIAESIPSKRKTFIATCEPRDEEMRKRVLNHQKERGNHWRTLEESVDIAEVLKKNGSDDCVILIDCLTLWVNNLIMAQKIDSQKSLNPYVEHLVKAIIHAQYPVVIVTNEVGMGIVPENKLARLFRDLAGHVNERVALKADRVIWMVAGIPVTIK